MGHYAVKHIQVWRSNADFDGVRFLYWIRNTYESMKLFFNPKTIKTIIVKAAESGSVFRTAGDNSDWQQLTSVVEHDLQPLRRGKKESYEFLDFYDEMEDFLTERYGLKKHNFMTYLFKIGSFEFVGRYTTNECNEPFLKVEANLPRKVLADILWELRSEENEFEHENWED